MTICMVYYLLIFDEEQNHKWVDKKTKEPQTYKIYATEYKNLRFIFNGQLRSNISFMFTHGGRSGSDVNWLMSSTSIERQELFPIMYSALRILGATKRLAQFLRL